MIIVYFIHVGDFSFFSKLPENSVNLLSNIKYFLLLSCIDYLPNST